MKLLSQTHSPYARKVLVMAHEIAYRPRTDRVDDRAESWIDFRNLPSFKAGRPRLFHWYDTFLQRPSMMATDYSGETHD
jgi:glutathione S-transferase